MQHKSVEESVLNMYKRVNPSARNIEESNVAFRNQIRNRKSILRELCLPNILFENKNILEIGGGTGENSLYYAMNGANVTILEPNEISCDRAKKLFQLNNLDLSIINQSLFDLDIGILKKFDIIIAEGVLHHTYNTLEALRIVVDNMRSSAVIVVAIPEYHGWFKRHLQRLLISINSSCEEDIVANAKKYFQSHLDRAVKYGLRDEKNIIYDTFVNPQIELNKLENILGVFYECNIDYYSAYPTLNLFNETSPWSKTKVNKYDYGYYKDYYKVLEKIWMCSGEENLLQDIKDLDEFLKKIDKNTDILFELETKITNNNFKINELNPIQSGYLGQGMNYFVGIKHEC